MAKCPPDCEGCWADYVIANEHKWEPDCPVHDTVRDDCRTCNTNSTVDRKIRRFDLGCSFCPPNRGENRKGRPPRPDRHKNKRRL